MRRGLSFLLLLFFSYYSIGQTIKPAGLVNICLGQTKKLIVEGLTGDTTIQWQKNGVDIANANKEEYTVTSAGEYKVKFKDGKFTDSVKVVINPYPVAAFSSSFILNQCSNDPVSFTNMSGEAASYVWDFGDPKSGIANNTSTQKDPKHTFIGIPGNATQPFTIKLKAISAAGGCESEKEITISTKQIPDGALGGNAAGTFQGKTYFKICGNFPQGEFTFSNSSSTRATNVDYRIIWGDNSPDFVGTDFNLLKHTYAIGTHKLTFIINGVNGCRSTTEYFVFVGTNPAVGLANPGNTAVCSGESLTFPITETANNVPGTIYTITFNDGSIPKVYIHPAVPSFESHKFEITSCGTTSSDGTKQYQNSFSASIEASNPCASSSASIVPIYVSEKPKADFAISPMDTICVNTKVTLKNTSKNNVVDNGACREGNAVWTITPATGWTLANGSLGDDFNSNLPSIWKSGSDVLGISFTLPGVYSVTLKTGSDFCGINEKTQTICVNPFPAGSFTLDKKEGCGPLMVTATSKTSIPTCGKMRYLWTVKYGNLPDCGPSVGDFKFISGTNNTSPNPVFQLNEPGLYTIALTVINPGAACSTQVSSQTVTVKSKPVISVSNIPATLCQNNFIEPAVSTRCAYEAPAVYIWTFSGGVPASSSLPDPGKIFYNTPGKHLISLKVTNECGITTFSGVIDVQPTPDLTLPPDIIACAGEDIGPLIITVLPVESSITWTNHNAAIGLPTSGASGTLPKFRTLNATNLPNTALIDFSAKLGKCVDAGTLKIVVNPRPNTPVVTDITYCENALATPLTAKNNPGNTLVWYTTATGEIAENQPPVPETAVPGVLKFYVSQRNTLTQCESNRVLLQVTIHKIPIFSTATSTDPSKCASSTGAIILSGLEPNTNYQVDYTKNASSPVQIPISTDATGKLIIPGLSAGQYTNVFVSLNNCASKIAGPFDLKDPAAPVAPVATVTGPVCTGSFVTFTASSAEAGSLTYHWTGPDGFQKSEQNPTLNAATLSSNGTYQVTINRNGCTSKAATVDLVINERPSITSTNANTPVCSGATLQLNSSTTFGGLVTYNWSGPNGFSSKEKDPAIINVTQAAAGTYKLKIISEVGSCTSGEASEAVIVNPTPVVTKADKINPLKCASATGSITLEGLTSNTIYLVTYSKDGAIPFSGQLYSGSNGHLIIPGLSAGTYQNIQVTLKGCVSESVGPFILSDPNPPVSPTINSDSEVCVGKDIFLKAVTMLPGTLAYNWSGPQGFISYEKDPVLPKAAVAMSGIYRLTIIQNNCVSLPVETNIIVNTLPGSPAVSPVFYCIDLVAQPLQATSAAGNILNWYTDPAAGIGDPTSPLPSTTVAGVVTYYVSQVDKKGCVSERVPLPVTINPEAIAEFAPPSLIQCPPFNIATEDINLKKYPLKNAEYRWYADNVYIGSGTEFPGYTLASENKSVVIKLKTLSLYGCKSDSVSHTFSTPKLPRPSFTLSANEGCGPLAVTVLNTTPDMNLYNYQWSFAIGQTSSDIQPGTIIFPPNATFADTIYQVKLVISSICDNIVLTKPLLVKSKPKALFTPTITEGCSPMKVTFKNTSKGLNTTYHWDFGDGKTYDTNIPEDVRHIFYAGTVTNFTVRLTASNECGEDYSEFIITVAPNQIKLNFAMNGPDHFGCQPHTVNFFNNSSGASAYFWDFGDGNFKSTTLGVETVTHTYLTPGKYEVKLVASSNCSDTTTTDYVTIYPKPKAAFMADRYTSCKGEEVNFQNQSELGTSYLWSFGDGTTSSLAEPGHLYTVPGIYTVRLTVYKLNGPGSTCTDFIEKQLQVVENLPGLFTMSDSNADCAPLTVTFENKNLPAVNALWDFGDGTAASGDRVIHSYQFSGTYTVTLKSTAPGGCTYTTLKTVEVNGPSGTLQYAGGFACAPSPVRLEAVATNTNTYQWDFGEGNTLTNSNGVVFHEYTKPGTYLPSVALMNNSGCKYFIKGKDSIKIDRVEAGFISVQNRECGRTNVIFTDTSHVFFGIRSVRWNVGDGLTREGKTVNFTYSTSGKYWIEMAVTSNSGCTQTVRRQVDVSVYNIPAVAIIAEAAKCSNQSVLFRSVVQSEDSLNIYKWSISNGVTGTGKSFNYTFVKPGIYKVDLMVSTVNNCSATSSHTIEIKPSPVVKASGDVTICLGSAIQLNASGAVQYQWAPLQGLSCNTCPNPIATPNISTPYIIEGLNSIGCPDYDTINVTVIQPLKMTSSGNDSICIGQAANLRVSGAASYIWTPAQTLSSSTDANPVATPALTTGYRVVGYDGHNCFTDTAFIIVAVGKYPTVELGEDKSLATGTILPLATTVTNGPVKDWKWTPSTDLDCATCPLPNAHVKKDISYQVEITNIYGCKAKDAITLKVFCESAQVFIPNAFTPDGDGINDVLMVRGKGIVTVKSFRIFNRWGQLVFERNNFPPNEPAYGWDGKIAGRSGPPEVYVFTAEVICENGVPYTYKGNTTIIK